MASLLFPRHVRKIDPKTGKRLPIGGQPQNASSGSLSTRAMAEKIASSGDTTAPKKKRRGDLGAPTNIGKKRLLGG